MSGPEIVSERIEGDIEMIAGFTESEIAHSRPTFSPAWRAARDYVSAEASAAGCEVHVDAAGNLHARPAWLDADRPALLCGSHLDSVPTGGKYDGVVGVVVALEVLRACPAAPVELIVFAEEEGTTFGLGMLGSRAWAGTIEAVRLAQLRNRDGEDYLSAGIPHGVRPAALDDERLVAGRYSGLIEVHVEQGQALWNNGTPIAVVTAINGRRQYRCRFEGQANHAGSTRMGDRRDALVAGARAVVAIESLARELDRGSPHTVMTVGSLTVEPNAVNVIPGGVFFTVDFRAASDETLRRGESLLATLLEDLADRSGVSFAWECSEELPVIPLDAGTCRGLQEAAARLDIPLPETRSGALHDAAILAPFLPTSMVFVASRDGISHNPAEFSRVEDIALAARVVAEAATP